MKIVAGRKKMKKSTRSNLMTFGFVIAFWALIEIVRMTGHMTAKIGGLLIPVCAYVVMAISLNLVVGFLGELSLGLLALLPAILLWRRMRLLLFRQSLWQTYCHLRPDTFNKCFSVHVNVHVLLHSLRVLRCPASRLQVP